MTHQSKISSSIEIARWRQVSWPVALAILVLGLMVGVFATQLSTAENNNEVNRQRAIEAEAARYTSLDMFYAAGNEAQAERAIEAEAARYSGLAEFYLPENAANGQRAIEAEAARYNGLAEFFMAGK